MGVSEPGDQVAQFTRALLGAGSMLFSLAADLTEALPEDAYPGEDPGAVVIEMMTGTIRTVLGEADPRDLERATDLIGEACERIIEHLRLALELSKRIHGPPDGDGRTYG